MEYLFVLLGVLAFFPICYLLGRYVLVWLFDLDEDDPAGIHVIAGFLAMLVLGFLYWFALLCFGLI
jgi:Kef-type K+ transport system membrane component KefB